MVKITHGGSSGSKAGPRKAGKLMLGTRLMKRKGGIACRVAAVAESVGGAAFEAPPTPVSSSNGTPSSGSPGTPMLCASFVCVKCEEPTTISSSQSAGGGTAKRICNQCNSTKAAWRLKTKGDAKLKAWFLQLEGQEAKIFFRRQKLHTKTGSFRKWDLTQFEQWATKSKGEEDRARVWWQPFCVWSEEQSRNMEFFGCSGVEVNETLKKRWTILLADKSLGSKMVKGVWCVPKFMGLISDEVILQYT
jgi:hypothetical protein